MALKCLVDAGWSDVDKFGQNLSRDLPLLFSPDAGQTIKSYLDAMQPDIAWGILVVGMVFLYLSLTPSRKRSRSVSKSNGIGGL
jgi:hypothetical protein